MAMGQNPGFDVAVLSDWMIDQFIGLGWARELDPRAVPHAANLLPALRASPLAGVLGYSLPWQGGLTGIGYNLAATGRPARDMRDLLTAPDLRGRVGLVMDMRDDVGTGGAGVGALLQAADPVQNSVHTEQFNSVLGL